jgi:RNA recognition motif-containing protein
MNIYVGNLPHSATEQQVRTAFEAYGSVDSINLIKDRETGDSRGFGFVNMDDNAEAKRAIAGLDDTELGGRKLTVNEAKPRTERAKSW